MIGLVLAFGCKRAAEEADTCEDEDAPAAAASAPSEPPAAQAPAAGAQAQSDAAKPGATSTPDPEEARRAVESMLQDVRKQLEQKTSELGKLPPNEPPKH
jgi:hypothetical protein